MPNVRSPAAAKRRRMRQRGGRKKKRKQQFPADQAASVGVERGYESLAAEPSGLDASLTSYLTQISGSLTEIENTAGEDELGGRCKGPDGAEGSDEGLSAARLLCRNALKELLAKVHEVARDPMGSRVLERLVRVGGGDEGVEKLAETLFLSGKGRVLDLAKHRCGSHVLERVITVVCDLETESEAMRFVLEFFGSLAGEEVVELISDPRGSHVFRVMVASLSGLPVDEPREIKLNDNNGSSPTSYLISDARHVSKKALQAVLALNEVLLSSNINFSFLSGDPYTSTGLQSLLSACMRADQSGEASIRLATAVMGGEKLPYVFDMCFHPCGSRLVERVILCMYTAPLSRSELLRKGITKALEGHYAEMAEDPKANFVLQRWLLMGVHDRGGVARAWRELEEKVPELFGSGSAREGVLLALARCAEVYGDHALRCKIARAISKASVKAGKIPQSAVVLSIIAGSESRAKFVLDTLRSWGESDFNLPSDLGESASDASRKLSAAPVLHPCSQIPRLSHLGVLLARCLIRYKGNAGQPMRDSMSSMPAHVLLGLALDAAAARAIEQQLATGYSGSLASKVVEIALGRKDLAILIGLARSPCGSVVLQRAAEFSSIEYRERVVHALGLVREQLTEEAGTRILVKRLRVDEFVERPEIWKAREKDKKTVRAMFSDILDDDVHTDPSRVAFVEGGQRRSKTEKKRSRVGIPDMASKQSGGAQSSVEIGKRISKQRNEETENTTANGGIATGEGSTEMKRKKERSKDEKHKQKNKKKGKAKANAKERTVSVAG